MTDYKIITVPHASLKQKSNHVNKVDDAIRVQMDGMLKAMYDAPGIGLAANQVNILNRVLVMDLSRRNNDKDDADSENEEIVKSNETTSGPIFMANPEVIYESEEWSLMEEGCLSLPQQYADVERPAIVRVKYLDYNGKKAEIEAGGLLSHCLQHEIDHLDGLIFVDHISSLKRRMILKKLDKIKKQDLL